jgi:oxygen-dependent protoporphyrinogen oxidase
VIFDSDREFTVPTMAQPTCTNRGADTVHGTKLTVMLGGPYWDDMPTEFLPDATAAIEMAKTAVERHLHLDPSLTAQAVASAKLCRDALPQHTVGHLSRMRAAHSELEWGFKGRLAVAGQSYQSPGVLPSIRAARDMAMQVAGAWQQTPGQSSREVDSLLTVGDTGLNRFAVGKPQYMRAERFMLPLRYRSGAYMGEDGMIQPGARWKGKGNEEAEG